LNPVAGGVRAPTLASAPGRLESGSPHPFTLDIDLTTPATLYASYRRRMWLTAGLILSAMAAAMAGLAGMWRNLRRQALLNEMKSNFVSSVSHELRAPIAALRLMAESLDRGKITDEAKQRSYFRLIVHECRRLSSLVENVLDFSRIDQGSKRYTFEPIDVAALARQAVSARKGTDPFDLQGIRHAASAGPGGRRAGYAPTLP
jgi:signal transduction histidine kinase